MMLTIKLTFFASLFGIALAIALAIPMNSIEQDDRTIPMPFGIPDEDGQYHVDDLRLSEAQFKYMYGASEEERQALTDPTEKWDGNVPYVFDSAVTEENKAKVNKAIKSLNAALENCLTLRLV